MIILIEFCDCPDLQSTIFENNLVQVYDVVPVKLLFLVKIEESELILEDLQNFPPGQAKKLTYKRKQLERNLTYFHFTLKISSVCGEKLF